MLDVVPAQRRTLPHDFNQARPAVRHQRRRLLVLAIEPRPLAAYGIPFGEPRIATHYEISRSGFVLRTRSELVRSQRSTTFRNPSDSRQPCRPLGRRSCDRLKCPYFPSQSFNRRATGAATTGIYRGANRGRSPRRHHRRNAGRSLFEQVVALIPVVAALNDSLPSPRVHRPMIGADGRRPLG